MSRVPRLVRFVTALALAGAVTVQAASACTGDDFAKAVDEAGAALRAFNLESAPKLQARLRQFKGKKGWPESEHEATALEHLADSRTAELDAKSNELLAKIDALGRPPSGQPDCAKLVELKAAGAELMGVMRAKSAYLLAKIGTELGDAPAAERSTAQDKGPPPAPPAPKSAAPPPATKPLAEPRAAGAPPPPAEPPRVAATAPPPPAEPKVAAAPPPPPPKASAPPAVPQKPKDLKPKDAFPARPEQDPSPGPTADLQRPPPSRDGIEPLPPLDRLDTVEDEQGYTIEEVREATRGFFGTISTSLASVLEHAFRNSGRPTAYVLGQEGSGAFLAGLRYGSGTMYLRRGGTRPIYWHGPSLGTDFGASGSRTMFLIYNLHDPEKIYRHFSGIDGSAYLVGGVGITYLKGGEIVMAPIRSGLGLRVGASLGYIRFTPEASWNPF